MSVDSLLENQKRLEAYFEGKHTANMKSISDLVQASLGEGKRIREEGIPAALAAFGFKWAQAASRPGARFLGSAAEASPTIAEVAGDYRKAARAADQADLKLQLTMKQFEIAQQENRTRDAMMLSHQIETLKTQRDQLALHAQQIAQQGAYQQGMLGIHGQELDIKKDLAKIRGIQAAASALQGQARMTEASRKVASDFDNSMQARKLMKELTEQYGPEKAKYMYGQQRRAYIQENTQGVRDQIAQDANVRSVYDLLNAE